MERAKLFMSEGDQAILLPKGYEFEGKEVEIKRVGNVVMLSPVKTPLQGMLEAIDGFTEDFLRTEIEELPMEERDGL